MDVYLDVTSGAFYDGLTMSQQLGGLRVKRHQEVPFTVKFRGGEMTGMLAFMAKSESGGILAYQEALVSGGSVNFVVDLDTVEIRRLLVESGSSSLRTVMEISVVSGSAGTWVSRNVDLVLETGLLGTEYYPSSGLPEWRKYYDAVVEDAEQVAEDLEEVQDLAEQVRINKDTAIGAAEAALISQGIAASAAELSSAEAERSEVEANKSAGSASEAEINAGKTKADVSSVKLMKSDVSGMKDAVADDKTEVDGMKDAAELSRLAAEDAAEDAELFSQAAAGYAEAAEADKLAVEGLKTDVSGMKDDVSGMKDAVASDKLAVEGLKDATELLKLAAENAQTGAEIARDEAEEYGAIVNILATDDSMLYSNGVVTITPKPNASYDLDAIAIANDWQLTGIVLAGSCPAKTTWITFTSGHEPLALSMGLYFAKIVDANGILTPEKDETYQVLLENGTIRTSQGSNLFAMNVGTRQAYFIIDDFTPTSNTVLKTRIKAGGSAGTASALFAVRDGANDFILFTSIGSVVGGQINFGSKSVTFQRSVLNAGTDVALEFGGGVLKIDDVTVASVTADSFTGASKSFAIFGFYATSGASSITGSYNDLTVTAPIEIYESGVLVRRLIAQPEQDRLFCTVTKKTYAKTGSGTIEYSRL